MTKEELLAIGLNEEQIPKVFAINGKDVTNAQGEVSIKDATIVTLTQDVKDTKELLQTANDEIKGFKDLNIDDIQTAADDYKIKYDNEVIAKEAAINELKIDFIIDEQIVKAQAKNKLAAKALLDIQAIKESKDPQDAAEKAVALIVTENDYLFGAPIKSGTGGSKGNGGKDNTPPPAEENYGKTLANATKSSVSTDTSAYEL